MNSRPSFGPPENPRKYKTGDRMYSDSKEELIRCTAGDPKIAFLIWVIRNWISMDEEDKTKRLRQIAIVKRFDHRHVIGIEEEFEAGGNYYVVLKNAGGGTLKSRIQTLNGGSLPENWCWWCLTQVLLGVEHIHNKGFVHGDIKQGNVYMRDYDKTCEGEFWVACLGGFGSPQELTRGNEKEDVLGLGNLLYSMLFGQEPQVDEEKGVVVVGLPRMLEQAGGSENTSLFVHRYGRLSWMFFHLCKFFEARPMAIVMPRYGSCDLGAQLSAEVLDLLKGMLDPNPARRLTMQEIKYHPWMVRHAEEQGFVEVLRTNQ